MKRQAAGPGRPSAGEDRRQRGQLKPRADGQGNVSPVRRPRYHDTGKGQGSGLHAPRVEKERAGGA